MPGPNLFFINSKDIINNHIVIADATLRHIKKVLRLAKGDRIWAGDDKRRRYLIELTEIDNKRALAKILEIKESSQLPSKEIILAQSILKGEKMDMLIQKATELGIAKIIPVISERTIVKIKEGSAIKEERWQKIAKEASQQCGRWDIPEIGHLKGFEDTLENMKGIDLGLILWEGERTNRLKTILRSFSGNIKVAGILIGPEGGFTEKEVGLARQHRFISVTMGDMILRAETAAITAIGIIQYEFGIIG
ncbi:MAG: RsmE family RNA methyltransferase [Nitrospirota bacterium]